MNDLFEKMYQLNVSEHIDKKNGFSYLTWTYAYRLLMNYYPDATYKKLPYIYDTNLGYMVGTEITANGITKEMWLSVMDNRNNAMKDHPYKVQYGQRAIEVAPATMNDIANSYMRCLVKNIGMFGLGLSLYAGEDIPQELNTDRMERWEGLDEVKNKQR